MQMIWIQHTDGSVRDQLHQYASELHSFIVIDSPHVYRVHYDVTKREHPEAFRPFIPELKEFNEHNHFNVLQPILR